MICSEELWDTSPRSILIAHSLGEASAENKGHGPETSRDADGQDRSGRHKAQSPVAEGNTSTSRGAKARQGRGQPVRALSNVVRLKPETCLKPPPTRRE